MFCVASHCVVDAFPNAKAPISSTETISKHMFDKNSGSTAYFEQELINRHPIKIIDYIIIIFILALIHFACFPASRYYSFIVLRTYQNLYTVNLCAAQ